MIEGGEPVLPEPVRQRIIALASRTLGGLRSHEVPPALRAAAKFTPSKRIRLAAQALAAALAADQAFRMRVAETAEQESEVAADEVRRGEVPAAADPVDLAALAYLIRPEGWQSYLERVLAPLREDTERERARERDETVARLREQLDESRAALREESRKFAGQTEGMRAELETARRRLRELTGQMRTAERGRTQAEEALAEERRQRSAGESATQAELRRLRQRLAEVEETLEATRRSTRESRSADETRLWLLLETVSGAVQGLRRELAVQPTEERPGDTVVGAMAAPGPATGGPADDPVVLDQLLALPRVHLVVDGYNVTKTGYGDLTLAAQRDRLAGSLGALAARTGAETTCVFDGADRPPAKPQAPRGVRVLFSPPDQTADELILRLVAAEPRGRPIVVITSDREIVDGVRRAGAYPVASAVLLRLLDRT